MQSNKDPFGQAKNFVLGFSTQENLLKMPLEIRVYFGAIGQQLFQKKKAKSTVYVGTGVKSPSSLRLT